METAALRFDEEAHRYFLGERELGGITRALLSSGLIDTTWYTEHGRDRGTAVHRATQYHDEGDLDEATVDAAAAPGLAAWKRFVAESGWTNEFPPEVLVCSSLGYATTIDRVGRFPEQRKLTILNLKTGAPQQWWRWQSAGEALAFSETYLHPLHNLSRTSLRLLGDGDFRLQPPYTDRRDFDVFKAALVIAQAKGDMP